MMGPCGLVLHLLDSGFVPLSGRWWGSSQLLVSGTSAIPYPHVYLVTSSSGAGGELSRLRQMLDAHWEAELLPPKNSDRTVIIHVRAKDWREKVKAAMARMPGSHFCEACATLVRVEGADHPHPLGMTCREDV